VPSFGSTKVISSGSRRGLANDRNITGSSRRVGNAWTTLRSEKKHVAGGKFGFVTRIFHPERPHESLNNLTPEDHLGFVE
jgi:transposase InsO family protein